jgi:hypothetical protein
VWKSRAKKAKERIWYDENRKNPEQQFMLKLCFRDVYQYREALSRLHIVQRPLRASGSPLPLLHNTCEVPEIEGIKKVKKQDFRVVLEKKIVFYVSKLAVTFTE